MGGEEEDLVWEVISSQGGRGDLAGFFAKTWKAGSGPRSSSLFPQLQILPVGQMDRFLGAELRKLMQKLMEMDGGGNMKRKRGQEGKNSSLLLRKDVQTLIQHKEWDLIAVSESILNITSTQRVGKHLFNNGKFTMKALGVGTWLGGTYSHSLDF